MNRFDIFDIEKTELNIFLSHFLRIRVRMCMFFFIILIIR